MKASLTVVELEVEWLVRVVEFGERRHGLGSEDKNPNDGDEIKRWGRRRHCTKANEKYTVEEC